MTVFVRNAAYSYLANLLLKASRLRGGTEIKISIFNNLSLLGILKKGVF
jgi:hypothetical protein